MRQVRYGYRRTLAGVSVEHAVERAVAALKTEGFGVLTEIDVQATMKAKLGVDHPPYRILGACNPTLAHQALEAEPEIGLLLPCNVVVAANDSGAEVQIANPQEMFKVVENARLEPITREVDARLRRVLERL